MSLDFFKEYSEFVGNTAGIIVLVSLLMRSLVRLRWINLLGSLIFCVYGILVGAPAIVLTNLGISFIDLWYLYKMYSEIGVFKLIEAEKDSAYYNHFMETNREEIRNFFGDYKVKDDDSIYYMLRSNNIAGVLIGNQKQDCFNISVDFVTPEYRDFKLGEYFFLKNTDQFKKKGIHRFLAKTTLPSHTRYLLKIGFTKISGDLFEKAL
jgi:N-acetylglutamate synthase-like GNAT family acetyltransferase